VEHGVPEKVRFIGRDLTIAHRSDNWTMDRIARINGVLATHDFLHTSGNLCFTDNDDGAVVAALGRRAIPIAQQ
jgi:hypothetical protein